MRIQLKIYAQDLDGFSVVPRGGVDMAKHIGAHFNIFAANFAEMFKIEDIFE